MHIDSTLLSPLSALLGALIGGGTSLIAAVYSQRVHDRLQRLAREADKREGVYADFVMSASNMLLTALVNEGVSIGADEQHLIGLINRMRLFAPSDVVKTAEAVTGGRSREEGRGGVRRDHGPRLPAMQAD